MCLGFLSLSLSLKAQVVQKQQKREVEHRCSTMEALNEAIQKDPTLIDKWSEEGRRQWAAYQQRQQDGSLMRTQAGEIIIPVVFHLVDVAAVQTNITDRDFYEQIEILNRDFSGAKLDAYKNVIPAEMAARVGRVPVKFVLARRTPAGALTSGIERRTGTTPSRTAIKTTAGGGLDAWDVTRYLNVWCGTFSGADAGLLGIATFPFTTTEGSQGVVIGSYTVSMVNTPRPYYTNYSEGATLAHEIGHYLYLWHTFGDAAACNNQDFRIQANWPLPTGAGPEGDDTPEEGAAPAGTDIRFGNPSMVYNDGCASTPWGIMYGSFMNYYDDRALFMFSDGHRKRVEGCINAYRPGLLTTNGATPPSAINDAFLVRVTPRGTVERLTHVVNNSPLTATVRNLGTSALTSVTLNVRVGAGAPVATTFALNLAAGSDTTLNLAPITATGTYVMTVYATSPNGATDAFLHNDTLQSYLSVTAASAPAPLTENFSGATFPPADWQFWNPNGPSNALPWTWGRDAASGFTAAGSAYFNNFDNNQSGTLDELVMPPISFGTNDSSVLSFRVAHGAYDIVDPSAWDGLEVYVSGDGGRNYTLVYKKTGNNLKTITPAQTARFTATPAQPERWRLETVNLSPYIVAGQRMIVKFRNVTAWGNNTYIDDIGVTAAVKPQLELQALSINNLPDFTCNTSVTPSLTVRNLGVQTINNFRLTYSIDNGTPTTTTATATVTAGQTATVNLPAINAAPGTHILTVIANLPNGVADPNASNDTLRKVFVVFTTVTAPLVESFEGPVSFNGLPNGWAVSNPDAGRTWVKTGRAARKINASDTASVYVQNFGYTGANQRDDLYTPKVTVTNVDSVYARFDVAAATFNYPGATAVAGDTLEIFVTTDCGATLRSVYKKWGTELQTLRAPNDPNATEFVANFNSLWRTDSVYLSPYVGSSSTFQLVFRSSHNAPGNNIFLDNINVFGEVLPAALKQQGYLVLPTTFNTSFNLWFFETPTSLTGVNVYNSIGQLVWSKQYNRNAYRQMNVNLAGKAAGVYFVELRYADANRNTTQRVIKY